MTRLALRSTRVSHPARPSSACSTSAILLRLSWLMPAWMTSAYIPTRSSSFFLCLPFACPSSLCRSLMASAAATAQEQLLEQRVWVGVRREGRDLDKTSSSSSRRLSLLQLLRPGGSCRQDPPSSSPSSSHLSLCSAGEAPPALPIRCFSSSMAPLTTSDVSAFTSDTNRWLLLPLPTRSGCALLLFHSLIASESVIMASWSPRGCPLLGFCCCSTST
mmetsp:Transcript_24481/g.80218  ORF Transcript_24481/g.80218 Transcript_24481/m.80218 type:complete len:218 (+) Transcript_24481:1358-2011(+)